MKVIKLEQSHLTLQGDAQHLTTIVTIIQVHMKEVKDRVIKLLVDLDHLLKDTGKFHKGETIDESTIGKNSYQSLNHKGLRDSQVTLLPTP